MVLLFGTSIFAVCANAAMISPRLRTPKARLTVGGFVAHIGAGMLLCGIACLIAFGQTAERVALLRDRPDQSDGLHGHV